MQIQESAGSKIHRLGTNNHATFKVTLITLFLHSDTKFELQQDVLTISTSLNACCVELLPLSDYKFALKCS